VQLHSNVSLEQGRKNLRELISDLGPTVADWNEADTRFKVIDRILHECLGWSSDQVFMEHHHDGEYRDYSLGAPVLCIWEAKRSGIHFEFPADVTQKSTQAIEAVFAVSKSAEDAIRQVQGYCNAEGVEFAVVCNGHQLIAFIAQRIGYPHIWMPWWLTLHSLILR
jgi:predicted type IV restriction endonuclease